MAPCPECRYVHCNANAEMLDIVKKNLLGSKLQCCVCRFLALVVEGSRSFKFEASDL